MIMSPTSLPFTLRPATLSDMAFLCQLRLKTMKPYFEHTYGWNDAEERHKAGDELQHARIVVMGGEEVGMIKVIPKPDELHLHQMQIRPEFQGKGVGAELLRQTIHRSEALQIPTTLFVITHSPAKRLYERFGFEVTDVHEHHCTMSRGLG